MKQLITMSLAMIVTLISLLVDDYTPYNHPNGSNNAIVNKSYLDMLNGMESMFVEYSPYNLTTGEPS